MTAYVELQAHDTPCAWITGERGRGKTVLCYRIMSDYLKWCRKVAYCDAPIIHESRRNKTLFDALCEADLLVIDDLPKGFDAGWMVSQLHAILQARHEPRRRTIVTSEMTGSKCNDVFRALSGGIMGASTLDRLCFPHAQCMGIELTGDNLRRA
jgi:DNA replication protein DnaC